MIIVNLFLVFIRNRDINKEITILLRKLKNHQKETNLPFFQIFQRLSQAIRRDRKSLKIFSNLLKN